MVFDLHCSPDYKMKLNTIKGSVLFDYQFQTHKWYHIAIIHQKPYLTASFLKFFVNGNLQEEIKMGYMGPPGSIKKVKMILGSFEDPINKSIWSIGTLLFLEEIVLESSNVQFIFVSSNEYFGVWQGSGGADADPIGEISEKSQVSLNSVSALSSYVLSPLLMNNLLTIKEDKIAFAIFSELDLDFIFNEYSGERMFSLYFNEVKDRKGDIINMHNFLMNEMPSGVIKRKGKITSINFRSVFDGIWRLGGVAILIRLIDLSVVYLGLKIKDRARMQSKDVLDYYIKL